METAATEKNVYRYFLLSIILKGLISLAEVIVGAVIFFLTPELIRTVTASVNGILPLGEQLEGILVDVSEQLAHHTGFVALYLLSRGLIKALLIWALLKNQLWAYPASLLVMAAFIAYQCYQILTDHSFIIIGITIFDLFVVYFIWREYQIVEARRKKSVSA